MKDQTAGATKRDEIRQKVAKSKADLAKTRQADAGPPDGVRSLAMDYPFALVLGGIAIGVIAGAFIPRTAGRKLVRGALTAATIASELGLTYGRQAAEKTGDVAAGGRELLGNVGSRVGSRLEDLGENVVEGASQAGRKAAAAANDAAGSARSTGLKLARRVVKLSSHLRH